MLSRNNLDTSSRPAAGPAHAAVSAWSPTDYAAMRQARELARLGSGRTWTNPMVGAVVVANGEAVGTGFHHRAGDAHAEPLALTAAGDRARGATLYVNLEPCLHHGRTPPCVEAIRAAGVARVVVPALDPDRRVSGQGVEWLRARGIRVDVGCEAGPAILDNHGYYHDRLGIGPVVTLKMATSRDGMVARARGQRDRVTGGESQLDVHRLRAAHDAIAIGIETARIDRPRLDCRLLDGGVDREPVIVLFDTHAACADDAAWPAPGRELVVITGEEAAATRVRALEARGARVVRCATRGGHVDVRDALPRLSDIKLGRILVEGGPRLFASVVEADAWDAFWHYQSPDAFGSAGVPMAAFDAGMVVDEIACGDDTRRRHVREESWQRLVDSLAVRIDGPREGTDSVHGNR